MLGTSACPSTPQSELHVTGTHTECLSISRRQSLFGCHGLRCLGAVELGAHVLQELALERVETRIIDARNNNPLIVESMNLDGVMIDRTTDCSVRIVGVQRHYIAVPIEAKTRRGWLPGG